MASEAELWQNFYVMAGGAAAALTGLVLVALSLHLRATLGHPLYRDRAFSSLQGLVTTLLISCAVLTPQSLTAIGIEIGLLSLYWLARFAQFIRLFTGVQPHRRSAGGDDRRVLWAFEWFSWLLWVLAIAASGVLLLLADPRAFYLLDAAIAAGFVLIIWNVWVLMTEVAG